MIVRETAPCKVNLYLDVTGLRADGYHGIESVMATLPLADDVTVESADGITVSMTSDEELPDDLASLPADKNLAYLAAKLFFEESGIRGGTNITIEKRIPSRAGLGGGSADAGAVLRALNRMCGNPFSPEKLQKIALSLGADVPFCVACGVALCRGVGEIMTPVESKIEFHGVITSEKAEKASTAEAYRAVDRAKCSVPGAKASAADMASSLERGDFPAVCEAAYNVFGEAGIYPTDVREFLTSLGAPFVLMSGAGPSVVALTESFDGAKRIAARLSEKNCKYFVF